MRLARTVIGIAAACVSCAASAQSNYLGILKLPQAEVPAFTGMYAFSTPILALSPRLAGEGGYRLKLGYKHSRFLAVEGELVDFGRGAEVFTSPGNLASSFRSTGFGVDTIATLPLWRFSFYGRFGAFRGEGRNGFSTHSTSLLGEPAQRGTRLRYGLGVRYDFTSALGVRAELERIAPLGWNFANEAESDQFSVGVAWRF